MAPSTIVLVHGYWEGPGIWRLVAPTLEKHGFDVIIIKLPSTGTPASQDHKSPSMYDDIEVIRNAITSVVDQGHDVLVVGHSAGAFLGSHALRELTPSARKVAGKPGAVVKLAFITGALFPPGHQHGPAPFMEVKVYTLHIPISLHTTTAYQVDRATNYFANLHAMFSLTISLTMTRRMRKLQS